MDHCALPAAAAGGLRRLRHDGYGSGVTCRRRLRDWPAAGVWDALHQQLLTKLNAAGGIEWSRASFGGSHVRALLGGSTRVRAQSIAPERAQSTTLLVDATGIQPAVPF